MSRKVKLAVGALVLVAVALVAATHFDLIADHVRLVALVGGGAGGLLALTIPPTLPARNSGEQQVHYFRKRVQVTDAAAAQAGVKIGRLPSRAFIQAVSWHKATAFNSGTSDTGQLGTSAAGVDILAATTIATSGFVAHTSAAGLGLAVTGSGEVDIWFKWVPSGTAATTGDVTITIAYIPDGDQ